MGPPIKYDIAIERSQGQPIVIPWGNAPNWIKVYRDDLDNAAGIALIPKEGQFMPVVRVGLGGDRRWVIFSRVAGRITAGVAGAQVRAYCIGWQRTVQGENVKALTWVYPSGAIESADEPTMLGAFLRHAEEKSRE